MSASTGMRAGHGRGASDHSNDGRRPIVGSRPAATHGPMVRAGVLRTGPDRTALHRTVRRPGRLGPRVGDRWTRRRAHGHHGSARRLGPEDPGQLERRGLLELVVAARLGRLVRAPALERRPVPEPVALEVVVGDLGDPLGAERLPRQVLAAVPARGRAGQPLAGRVGIAGRRPLGPFLPRVVRRARRSRSGASSSASAARRSQVNDDVTPTWWSVPSSSNSPSSSDPMCVPGPFLCQRNPATTQSAVRWCLILSIARLPGWYGASSRLATTPSSPAPSNRSNQSAAVARSRVAGRQVDRRLGAAPRTASSRARRSPCGTCAQVLVAEREQVPGHERSPATPRPASRPATRPGGCAAAAPRTRARRRGR